MSGYLQTLLGQQSTSIKEFPLRGFCSRFTHCLLFTEYTNGREEITMETKLNLTKDVAGSECSVMDRYVFGRPGSAISGGIYIKKGTPLPDKIILLLKEEKEDAKL
jgi:hypothetical protein